MKKGQVTIFIIIAIVIIVAGFLVFMFYPQLRGGFASETDNINIFVEECIRDVGERVIYRIGQEGGYLIPPNLSTSFAPNFSAEHVGLPYYYLSDGKNYMPSKKEIENEISTLINDNLFGCIKNFENFPEFEITSGEIKTNTKIKNDEVILNVDYPIKIIKDKSTTILKEFKNIKIPVRFGIVYDSVYELMQDQLNYEDRCLSCMWNVAIKNDLRINMIDYEEIVIFIIRDENSELNGEFFKFMFANKYTK